MEQFENHTLYTTSPEFFSRYYLITLIVKKIFGKKHITVLEVGGKGTVFPKMVENENLPYVTTVTDILPPDETTNGMQYYQIDATKMPFADRNFTVVFSTDVLEHISDENKEAFIAEHLRLAKECVIIAAPFASEEVDAAEHAANNFFKTITGRDHPWLLEHFEAGKPKEAYLENLLTKYNYPFTILPSGNLDNWLYGLLLNFLPEGLNVNTSSIHALNRHFNKHLLQMNDFQPPVYRKIYVIFKDRKYITKFNDLINEKPDYTKLFWFKQQVIALVTLHQKNVQNQFVKLLQKNQQYERELLQIRSAKTFKMWQLYASSRDEAKKSTSKVRSQANKLIKIHKMNWRTITSNLSQQRYLFSANKWLFQLKLDFEKRVRSPLIISYISMSDTITVSAYKVDIIIPWYGDTNIFPLLDSLSNITDQITGKIVIINDAFPDRELGKKLEDYVKALKNSKYTYLKNPTNGGFVKTVNKGVRYTENDVVIMNSDVMPQGNWISYLYKAAYSDDLIATATPMSNNATIFSLPEMNKPNDDTMPEVTGNLLEKISPATIVDVPTCHGFCMFVKRSYLSEYGLLDESTYNMGYGEENDMSMWFFRNGLRNIAATRAYVMHLESQSFGDEARKKYIEENYQKLIKRYPEYHTLVHTFIKNDPFSEVRRLLHFAKHNIDLFTRESILVIVHKNPFKIIGGVERETLNMIEYLQSKHPNKQIILYYYEDGLNVMSAMIIYQSRIVQIIQFYENIPNTEVLRWLLQAFVIKHAIVEHLQNHSFAYSKILHDRNIKSVLFIHDYYFYSQIPDLLDQNGFYLGFKLSDYELDIIYKQMLPFYIPQSQWKKSAVQALQYFDTVLFNSEFTLDSYCQLLGIEKKDSYKVSYPEIY